MDGDILVEGTDEELLSLFAAADNMPDHPYIATTIRQEPSWEPRAGRTIAEEALLEFYRRMRPGDPPTLDNAREYLVDQLFDQRRYDLEKVGRYKLNQRLELDIWLDHRTLPKLDLVKVVERMRQDGHPQQTIEDLVFNTANAFYSHSPRWRPELDLVPVDPREFQR